MSKKDNEVVVGISERDLFEKPGISFKRFFPNGLVVEHLLEQCAKKMRFTPRGLCETDPSFKQIIPYCMITRGDEIFSYRRLDKSGEDRLVGKTSIGVGGHMNPIQGLGFMELMEHNMLRELSEEVDIRLQLEDDLNFEIVGMIHTDGDLVSSVHVAVVYNVILPLSAEVKVRETDTLVGKWGTPESLCEDPDNLELWTKICSEEYFAKMKPEEV